MLRYCLVSFCGVCLGIIAVYVAERLLRGRTDLPWAPCPSVRVASCIAGACLCASLYHHLDLTAECVELMGLVCVLMAVTITDLVAWVIPNVAVLCGVAIRIAYLVVTFVLQGPAVAWSLLTESLWGAAFVAVLIASAALFVSLATRTDSLGGGDLKLLMVGGLFFGWRRSVVLVLLACLLGAITAPLVRRLVKEHDGGGTFPFGPAIAVACWATALIGDAAVTWYLGMLP